MAKCPYCGETLTANEEGVLLCAKCNKRFRRKETQAPTSAGEQASGKPDGTVAAQTASNHGETAKTESRPTQPAQIPAEENSQTAGTDVAADVTETTGSSAAATPVAGNTAEQDEIAQLRARIAAMEAKESERERGKRGSVLKKLDNTKFAPVVAFTKKWGLKAILPAVLVLIALITLLTCFCGLRGIYVNVDDPDEFFSFSATGYEWYYKLDGEQVLDKGKWSKSGNSLTLKYEDEWFGEVEESYQLKDFSWSSFTLYDSFFEEDKKFERVSVIGYKDSNKKATVTFYSNGGVGGGTHSLKIGSVLSSDETPTREGYLFMGWYTTPDGWKTGDGERFADNCRVWKDATYYANWKNTTTFTLTGDGLVNALEFTEGDNIETAYMRARGWNSVPEGVRLIFTDSDGNEINGKSAPAANVSVAVVYDDRIVDGTLQYVNPALKEYTIPAEVDVIASGAFDGCTALEKIYITSRTSSLTVQSGAFDDCERLTSIEGYADTTAMKAVINASGITRATVVAGTIVSNAFSSCSGLTSVTIGNSVTSIGERAFYGCSGLTSVTIPDSVTSIKNYAFYGCSSLKSVTIGNGVTSIGSSAFDGCSGLTSVYYTGDMQSWLGKNWHSKIMSSGRTLYINGNKIAGAVVIPDGITSIPSYAFAYQTGITSITISDSVTSIKNYAFYGCSSLKSVTIGNGVTNIWSSAFSGCTGLTEINWNAVSVSDFSSGNNVFYNAGSAGDGLTVMFGDSVRKIPAYAFYVSSSSYQPNIKSVTIGNSVTSIGDAAFSSCSGLTSIYYAGDVAGWCGISGLRNIMSSGRTLYINGNKVEGAITIPDSVTSIGSYAFCGCSGLTSITIPDSVTSIGWDAFWDCSGLTSIYYAGDVAGWCEISGLDEIMSSGRTLYIDGNKVEGAVVIPDGVQSVPSYAFYYQTGITSITIPDSVTSIGSYAFEYCRGLTSVTIGNGVTSIGDWAFYNCSGLTSIHYTGDVAGWCGISGLGKIMSSGRTLYINGNKIAGAIVIPDGVQSVPSYAFRGQSGITSVVIPDSVTSIGDYAFSACSSLRSVTIGNGVTSIGDSAFSDCSGLTTITIPDSVTSIGDSAFSDCSGLTSITIPDSVTSIGSYAFEYCRGLTSVTIGNGVTSVGDWAFRGCSGLTSITIPDSVTSIEAYAFSGCTGLTSVTIPDSVTSIGWDAFSGTAWYDLQPNGVVYAGKVAYVYKGTMPSDTSIVLEEGTLGIADSAFSDCSGLTTITIPDSVTSIGYQAFSACSSLRSVTIGNGVTSIGSYAFEYCRGLTSVTIGNGVTSIGFAAFQSCSSLTSVTFENTSGWQVSRSSSFSSYTSLSSSDLSNRSTAATYLKSTYEGYYWRRV